MQSTKNTSKRKSSPLDKVQMSALKKFVKGFHTVAEAAEAIGIHRNVLDRVMQVGSGAPESIEAILKQLESNLAA